MTALGLIRTGTPVPCPPVTRFELTPDAWRALAAALPAQPELVFIALWADAAQVHALFWCGAPLLASVPVEAGLYAALSSARPGAALFERAVADLWGHQAADARDVRPWLDHGTWPLLRPLSDRPAPNAGAPEVPEMAERDGDRIGWGPLPPLPTPLASGPAHWRAAVAGDMVTALEARLGYAHRGITGLMRGKSPPGAARLAARINGAATVAHSTAFARAVEAALDTAIPPRAAALRTILGAVERVAVTLHDLHETAEACDLHAPELQAAREELLAACDACFGHRLLLDVVRPGGVHTEPRAIEVLDAALALVPDPVLRWPRLGVLPVSDALALAPGGAVGRASGLRDLRHAAATVASGGDVATRMALRAEAVAVDVALARAGLGVLPAGVAQTVPGHGSAEGLGVADGPQGPVWHWVRMAGGLVSASFAADPAWLHLPAFEAASVGASLDTLPGIAASFGLHLAGMEL